MAGPRHTFLTKFLRKTYGLYDMYTEKRSIAIFVFNLNVESTKIENVISVRESRLCYFWRKLLVVALTCPVFIYCVARGLL